METSNTNLRLLRISFLLLCGHYLSQAVAMSTYCMEIILSDENTETTSFVECAVMGFVTNAEFPLSDQMKNATQVVFVDSKFASFPKARSTNLPIARNISAIACGLAGTDQLINSDSIFVGTNIDTLILSKNHFPMLEQSIFRNLTNLKNLELEDCKIEHIDETTFEELLNLEMLHLGKNLLTSIATNTFKSLKQLVYLDLNTNRLSSLNLDNFKVNGNLKGLLLANNILTTLNISEDNFSLDIIDVTANQIKDGSFMKFLKTIKILSIAHNPEMRTSEDWFDANLEMKFLFMPEIEFQPNINLTRLLMGLPNLIELNIGHNSLKTLDLNNFPRMTSLSRLGLYGNQFVTIENFDRLKERLPNLVDIDVSDNDLNCSVLQMLLENWHQNKVRSVVWFAHTEYHPRNYDRSVLDLNIDGVKCRLTNQNQTVEECTQNNTNDGSSGKSVGHTIGISILITLLVIGLIGCIVVVRHKIVNRPDQHFNLIMN